MKADGSWHETGTTIHVEMWIEDLVAQEIYPGMQANLWAFCAQPSDPTHEPSVAAIELWQGQTCSVPGPTLRVQQGDRVVVDFVNRHMHHHTIHWHGQHTPWESDGVPGSTQDPVAPGELFTYEFVAARAGTLWYHCHVDTQFHVMQGLYGAMIVEPQDRSDEPDVDRDHLIVLSTLDRDAVEATPERIADPHADHQSHEACGETGKPGCQNPAQALDPDVFLLNGQSAPYTVMRDDTRINIAPGERVRLRFLNAGNTWEAMHPHGHDLTVTHLDGIPLGKEHWYQVDTLPIAPGQRIDAVIEGSMAMEGVWVFHTHVTSHVTNDGQYPGGMLTKIVYKGFEDQAIGAFASELMGGQAYQATPTAPEDQTSTQRTSLTSPEAGDTVVFPVDMPCALRRVVLTVAVDSPTSTMQALNDLRVAVLGPEGDAVAQIELGAQRYAAHAWHDGDARQLPTNLTLAFSGRSVEAVATTTLQVVYAGLERCGHGH